MINGICFSKDRAAQLDLFIRSIEKNAKNIFSIKVIYTTSNPEFEKGYEKLIEKFPEVKWIKEENFREQTIQAISDTESDYTCFFTDDDIIYRKVDEQEMVSKLEEDNMTFCFSMRLGLNTTTCYTMNCDNVIRPDFEDDKFISWDWSVHYMDFGYPLSVDGHIFRTKEIHKLTKKITFENPNTYEGRLQMFSNYPKKKMWSYKNSALVNSPSNIVQSVYQNRKGETHGVSTKELNDAFLSGRCIELDKIDFSNIVGCHQELELPLTQLKEA
jgi:hypothetical protein